MKAGQLARILQSVEPETEVSFTVGYDNQDRRNIAEMGCHSTDILTDITLTSVEIHELKSGRIRLDVNILPDIREFMKGLDL